MTSELYDKSIDILLNEFTRALTRKDAGYATPTVTGAGSADHAHQVVGRGTSQTRYGTRGWQ